MVPRRVVAPVSSSEGGPLSEGAQSPTRRLGRTGGGGPAEEELRDRPNLGRIHEYLEQHTMEVRPMQQPIGRFSGVKEGSHATIW